ncbi:MAG: Helix-turn-helix protein [Actinomycetota bacterium]|nr:Helix-turn-helix protein [Actinomycetota bacterium]
MDDEVDQRRYDFGRAIGDRRRLLGLSQEALANQIGFDRKSITRLENGSHSITIDRLWVITDALQVTIGELEIAAAEIAKKRELQ